MNNTASTIVGVDIGGTNVMVGVIVSHDGRLLSQCSMPTEAERGPEDGLQRIKNLIHQAIRDAGLQSNQIAGIGIGCAGPVDVVRGHITNPYTLPTWDDVAIVDYLDDHFGLTAQLLTDTQAAALGEYWLGAGKHTRNMLYVTISTGIGGGIIVDGSLYRGVGLLSGEVGHQVIDLSGPECYCGARGCWEMLAAGPAIAKVAAERMLDSPLLLKFAHGKPEQMTAQLVSQAAHQGDAVALDIMAQTGRYIGIGVANLMNILAPDAVILGGGVMLSWALLEAAIIQGINEREGMVPFDQIKILPSSLGSKAGIIGAAYACLI